ncbi:MAG: diguanylate cyclase, partial [Solirubrobacteraceae bacterium]
MLEAELHRCEQVGGSVALLLIELDDIERLTAAEPVATVDVLVATFVHAVRAAVRRQDALVLDGTGRAWIVARDTDRAGVQALGSRIAGQVGSAADWRDVPMTVSIGIGVLGEDGREARDLIGTAEES